MFPPCFFFLQGFSGGIISHFVYLMLTTLNPVNPVFADDGMCQPIIESNDNACFTQNQVIPFTFSIKPLLSDCVLSHFNILEFLARF